MTMGIPKIAMLKNRKDRQEVELIQERDTARKLVALYYSKRRPRTHEASSPVRSNDLTGMLSLLGSSLWRPKNR